MITLGQRQTNNINRMITLTVITLSGFHCIILYSKEYDLEQKYSDDEGRQHIAVIGNDERKFIVVNAYFPNDHKPGVTFAEQMYSKVLEVQSEYPDHITFCAGDMNVCLSSND